MFLPYYIGNGLWIKGQDKGNRDIRVVNGKGRNYLKEKRKREEEEKEGKGEAGCRPNYCLMLNVTVCSDEKNGYFFFPCYLIVKWVSNVLGFFFLLLDC